MANTNAGQKGQEIGAKVGQAAGNAVDRAQDAAAGVADKARDLASTAGHKLHDAAGAVGRKAEDATEALGSGMRNLGGAVRDHGPSEGMLGSATKGVANALESGGRYLEEEGLHGMADDLSNLIRRNPIPSLLVGVGIGFLLARVTRS
jgi:hypothetical protein